MQSNFNVSSTQGTSVSGLFFYVKGLHDPLVHIFEGQLKFQRVHTVAVADLTSNNIIPMYL